ncbi:MAG: DUF350 domain-containing protein [Robiginitomaculum sp.]|nr:DUF350 domain-containing protein [Robiginitomaculum sp.]
MKNLFKTASVYIGKNPIILFALLVLPALFVFNYLFGTALTQNGAAVFMTAILGVILLFAAIRLAMFFKFFSHIPYVEQIKDNPNALSHLLGSIFIGVAIVVGLILGG